MRRRRSSTRASRRCLLPRAKGSAGHTWTPHRNCARRMSSMLRSHSTKWLPTSSQSYSPGLSPGRPRGSICRCSLTFQEIEMVLPSTTPPLRILLSAYSCEPGKGSEPGVGWHWAVEMARLGHCVSVLTRQNNREAIELALGDANAKTYASNLSFIYYDLPGWARWWKRNGRGVHLYYLLWQIGAYGVARKAHLRHAFEAVHHLTFGVLRQPSLMGRMGIPFVIGPLGGGESTPPMLRRFFPFRSRVREWARDMGNFVCRYDPLVRGMYRDAGVVLCKTPESLAWVPERYRSHSRCMLEIGIDAKPELPDLAESAGSELRLVYVGLFFSLKGMAIGLG